MSIKLNGFKLHNVKFRKDLGITAEYSLVIAGGDEPIRKKMSESCSAAQHPDMGRITSRLRCHFACIHGIIPASLVMKDLNELDELEQSKLQSVAESITITGCTFIGSDESDKKFILSASREVLPNSYVGFSTPIITADDSRYEPSGELTELMYNLEDEVYQYLMEKKYAQLSLDFKAESANSTSDNTPEGMF